MKATNKSNHLKLIGRHALSKIFKKSKFIFGKIAVGKKQSAILVKNPSQVRFTGKLTQKIVKLCRIPSAQKLLLST